jgi:hypothetical protein
MPIAKLGLEGNIPSFFYGDGIDCCILVDIGQNPASTPLLTTKVETLTPWAISNAPTHLTFASA